MLSMIAIQNHTEKLVLQHLHRHSHNVKEKSNNALLVSLAQMQIKQPWSNIEGVLKIILMVFEKIILIKNKRELKLECGIYTVHAKSLSEI